MTGKEVMDKATKSLQDTLKPIYANWADALMREAYNAGRREALEDASDLCQAVANGFVSDINPKRSREAANGAKECAHAIRALSKKESGE